TGPERSESPECRAPRGTSVGRARTDRRYPGAGAVHGKAGKPDVRNLANPCSILRPIITVGPAPIAQPLTGAQIGVHPNRLQMGGQAAGFQIICVDAFERKKIAELAGEAQARAARPAVIRGDERAYARVVYTIRIGEGMHGLSDLVLGNLLRPYDLL